MPYFLPCPGVSLCLKNIQDQFNIIWQLGKQTPQEISVVGCVGGQNGDTQS
jgi:hypothetical protein